MEIKYHFPAEKLEEEPGAHTKGQTIWLAIYGGRLAPFTEIANQMFAVSIISCRSMWWQNSVRLFLWFPAFGKESRPQG
jgi:hypothetical protein